MKRNKEKLNLWGEANKLMNQLLPDNFEQLVEQNIEQLGIERENDLHLYRHYINEAFKLKSTVLHIKKFIKK